MIPTIRNLGDVTKADLLGMVEAGVEESETLDFKLEVPKKDGAIDFCKDISAMANTDGGCIVIGMREDKGAAAEAVGIVESFDALIRRLQQAAEAHIDPRIAIRIGKVDLDGSKYVALAATEKSRNGPHMYKPDERVYKRLPRNNQAM